MPQNRRQAWSKRPSTKKPYKWAPSQEERNVKNTFLEGLVKRVLNDKVENNSSKMACG